MTKTIGIRVFNSYDAIIPPNISPGPAQSPDYTEVVLHIQKLALAFIRYHELLQSRQPHFNALHHVIAPANILARVRIIQGRMAIDLEIDDLIIDISPRILHTVLVAVQPLETLAPVRKKGGREE